MNPLIDLEKIRQQKNLRKLSLIEIKVKKGAELKLLIGFIWPLEGINLKVNYATSRPRPEITEEDFLLYIDSQIAYLKSDLDLEVKKAVEVLKHLPANSLFRNDLLSVLSDTSGTKIKKRLILDLIEKSEKKIQARKNVKQEELKLQTILDQLQITEYHNYFSYARQNKRKLKLYVGPTNSGKTYLALNDLAKHQSGTYLSPLRLLAWEGKDELEKRGHKTNLITGEEKQIVPNALFSAQTIETLNFSEIVDCVLIDEVQMLTDPDRGWAWSQALIGAPCKELIMAGSPESEQLVRKIADLLGEELEVIYLKRFNPLEVSTRHTVLPDDILRLPEGTALIAFSRKSILAYKEFFNEHGIKASVIYGNLSPDVRREESRKFREKETKFLIASDAISLGLNLPISNIVFTSIEKFNGTETVKLTPMEVKQISGRAGRYGKFEKGTVTALNRKDLHYIKDSMNKEGHRNNFFYIKPSLEHILTIGEELQTDKLFPILTFFAKKVMSRKQGDLFVCANLDQQQELALLLDKIPGVSLEDKFLFANSPVPGDDHHEMFGRWVRLYQKDQIVSVPLVNQLRLANYKYEEQLRLENYVKMLNLYSWLTYKKPDHFLDHDQCVQLRNESNKKIESYLSRK